ncbi:hypothetical protein Acr_14g0000400 [Actinidia rufa]|uniref:C2H2-type domain-containing protein n=1 Tax=Actinidia rufa TaxID=165716 RepID=A0A7J0FP98_9ERIC|nr:hypothetical protein Acr_14g0000400 [Actinidia rufa]
MLLASKYSSTATFSSVAATTSSAVFIPSTAAASSVTAVVIPAPTACFFIMEASSAAAPPFIIFRLFASKSFTDAFAFFPAAFPLLGVLVNSVIRPLENPDKGKAAGKKAEASVEDLEAKRRKIMEGGAAEAVKLCTVCNVVCNGELVYSYHMAGKKHASMMKKHAVGVGVTTAVTEEAAVVEGINIVEEVVAAIEEEVAAEENFDASSIVGTESTGNGSMKRIKKRSRWMKDYMI